jgi:hypothetical protein
MVHFGYLPLNFPLAMASNPIGFYHEAAWHIRVLIGQKQPHMYQNEFKRAKTNNMFAWDQNIGTT